MTADSTIETTGDQDVHKNMFIIGLPAVDFKRGPRRINMGAGKFITVSADSRATRDAWIKAIQGVIDRLKKTRAAEAGYNQAHVESNVLKDSKKDGAATSSSGKARPHSTSYAEEYASESESESERPSLGTHNRPKRVNNTIRRIRKEESSGVNANVFNMAPVEQEVDHLHGGRRKKASLGASGSSNNLDQQGYDSDASVSSVNGVKQAHQSNNIKHTSVGRAKANSVDNQEGAPYEDDDCPLPNELDTCVLPSFKQSSSIPTGDEAVHSLNSSTNRKSISLKKNLYDNWVEVKTEDGQTYYYHKVSRVTR